MTHVPYRGTGPGLLAAISGEVNLMFAGVSAAIPHAEAGRVRVLGISSRTRIASAPDVPPIADAGVPGYEMASWLGLAAPAGTPGDILARLAEAIGEVAA